MYCVFDPIAGPTVVDQVPEGSIATALSTFPTTNHPHPHAHPHPSAAASSRNDSLERSAINRSSSLQTSQHGHSHPSKPGAAAATTATTEDKIVRSTSQQRFSSTKVLFDFGPIREFIIPKPELCGHLITKATRTSKILGFPIRIVDEKKYHSGRQVYNRNAFIFNLCFIFERDAELSVFEPVVRKVGRTLRLLEESSSILSDPPPNFSISDLLEQIYMDLNNFSEASIRIGDTELELFLTPFYKNPKPVKNSDVPLAICKIDQMKHPSWDVTLYKICNFINGVNHVKRIAELAEVDLHLARLSIQHLVFYGAIIIVDLFQFTNTYVCLPSIAEIVHPLDEEDLDEGSVDLRLECENYVYHHQQHQIASTTSNPNPNPNPNSNPNSNPNPESNIMPKVPFSTLLQFYSGLKSGLSISSWCEKYELDRYPIDVRRMIQFGIVKGFLKRSFAYPIWLDHPALIESIDPSSTSFNHDTGMKMEAKMDYGSRDQLHKPFRTESSFSTTSLLSSLPTRTHPPTNQSQSSFNNQTSSFSIPNRTSTSISIGMGAEADGSRASRTQVNYPNSLPLMMNGKNHTDEICVKYGISFRQLETVFKALGDPTASGVQNRSPTEEDDAVESEEEEEGGKRRSRSSQDEHKKEDYGNRLIIIYA